MDGDTQPRPKALHHQEFFLRTLEGLGTRLEKLASFLVRIQHFNSARNAFAPRPLITLTQIEATTLEHFVQSIALVYSSYSTFIFRFFQQLPSNVGHDFRVAHHRQSTSFC